MALTNAALSQTVVEAVMLAFFDVAGDPVRAALAPRSIEVPAGFSGDADLDGHTFDALDPQFIDVSPVTHGEGGADGVKFSASATIAADSDLLNLLANPANFRGRVGKLWIGLTSSYQLIQIRPYYVGYMVAPDIEGDADGQLISVSLENYLAILASGAPSRTLLSQRLYDAGDASADTTAGAANAESVSGAAGLVNGLYGRMFEQQLAQL